MRRNVPQRAAIAVAVLLSAGALRAATSHGPNDPALDGSFLVRTARLTATPAGGAALPFEVYLPAAASTARPVVLVVHGYATVGEEYSWIAQHLASRGWVAALVEVEDPLSADVGQWTADTTAALDALTFANSDPSSGVMGELDLARVAIVGHSYGATTAIAVAARDSRIKAVAAIEPGAAGLYYEELLANAALVKVPLLVVGGELDTICPPPVDGIPAYLAAASAPSRLFVEIARGDHLGMLDFAVEEPPVLPYWEEHPIASRYLTAWIETFALGLPDPQGYTTGAEATSDVQGGDLSLALH